MVCALAAMGGAAPSKDGCASVRGWGGGLMGGGSGGGLASIAGARASLSSLASGSRKRAGSTSAGPRAGVTEGDRDGGGGRI